jgi:PAS domain S-box-containing protein
MADRQVHLLLIEDNPDDAKLIQEMLKKAAVERFDVVNVNRLSTGLKHITEKQPDVILLDLGLPDSQGLDALTKIYNLGSKIPIVVLTGWDDQSASLAAIKQGAQDYLIKGKINGSALWRVVNYAIEREKLVQELQESEMHYHELVEKGNDGIIIIQNGNIEFANPQIAKTLGLSLKEILGKPFVNMVATESRNMAVNMLKMRMAGETVSNKYDLEVNDIDGKKIPVEINASVIKYHGQTAEMAIIRDITERKLAEATLRQSENKYRELTESISDVFFAMDNELRYTHWNKASEKLTGVTAKDAIGRRFSDIFPENEATRSLQEMYLKAIRTQQSQHFINEYPGGQNIIHEITVYPSKDGISVFIKDITERRQAEKTIAATAELLKTAQTLGKIGSWEVDLSNLAITWSEEVYVLYERDPKLGSPSPEQEAGYYSPEQAKILRDYTGRAIGTGQSFSSDLEMKLPSGKKAYFHAIVQPVKDSNNKVVKLSGTVQDITEQKLAEEALLISEEYNSSLVENSPYPIQVINLDTTIRHVNPAFEKLTGYTKSEIYGIKPPFPWWTLEYLNRDRNLLEQGMQSGLENAELHCRKKNGELFWAEVKSVVKEKQGNNPGYYLSMWTDITQRKKNEEELSRLNEELRTLNSQLEAKVEERTKQLEITAVEANSANKAKSEFLASMSHELRTPLNAISGFAQVLQQQYAGQLNEKQTKYVGNILESSKHLLSLISDILDLSKIEAGKDELVLSNIKIKELLEGSLVMVKDNATKHGIKLGLQMPTDVTGLEIEADERKVKQIVFNLLSNAVKFTPDGGSVTIECIKEEKELIIRISDNGIGLTPEQQKKLFERFYQVSGGITAKTPGTGLGLSLARHMTEMHGGRMWVESGGLGKGSCFSFTLPLSRISAK